MRQRLSEYYLDEINSDVALYADNTVGELEIAEVEIEEVVRSRVEGREHKIKRTVERLAQVALHDSLADYTASKRARQESSGNTYYYGYNPVDEVWTIEDIPADVVARYEKWRDSYDGPSIEDIRKSAKSLIAEEDDLDKVSPCKSCAPQAPKFKHACHGCGYSREFYNYPLIRIDSDEGKLDVPFDLAGIVALNPEAITLESHHYIEGGELHAKRMLQFHPDRIPGEYINSSTGGMGSVDKSDKLHRGIEIVLDYWEEDENRAESTRGSYEAYFIKGSTLNSPEDYIKLMQEYASHSLARERPGGEWYEQKYQEILKKAGEMGLALSFRHSYVGMGETQALLRVIDPKSNFAARKVVRPALDDVRTAVRDINALGL